MNEDLRLLYTWTQGSRERVFRWLETLPAEVYTQERTDFAYGSLRNIQAHMATCYRVWLGEYGLHLPDFVPRLQAADIPDVSAMRATFSEVDRIVEQALATFENLDTPLEIEFHGSSPKVLGQTLTITRRWLVTHCITHEFHHKGQLLALGRVLGHPVGLDTDLLAPFAQP